MVLNRTLFKRHLEDAETIARIVHKHWLVGLRALFWPTALIALTVAVAFANPTRGMISVTLLCGFVLGVWWLRNFFDYFLDAWIITNKGVIDVAWHGWFHRESSRILYSDIEGVSYEIKGVIPTLLRIGTIGVEKISTGNVVELEWVKHPKRVEGTILHCMEAYLHSKNLKDASQVQKLLAAMVAEQINLREQTGDSDDDE